MKNSIPRVFLIVAAFIGGILTEALREQIDSPDLPSISYTAPSDTGMWHKPGEIGVVIDGEHILTIYRDGLPTCKEEE